MKLNFKWKENTAQYQTGESLYLNRIKVGSYGYNSTRPRSETRDTTKDYVGHTFLPQATSPFYGQSPDEIKTKIERHIRAWFIEVLGNP